MNRTRWGIMGTGRIAGIFCDMLVNLDQAKVYAVASRDEEKAREFGQKYGAERCYGSYEELVSDENVDIVYVATPIECHYENVKLCLNAGKNVLCEKALCASSAEAGELYELSKEKGRFLMEALWTKCQPVFLKVLEWNREGKFGQIRGIEARFYTKGGRNHRLVGNPLHGGILMDLLIYPMTYVCALLSSRPKEICAASAKGGDLDLDVMESIQLKYEDGSFAALTGGISVMPQVSLYIQGTKGRVLMEEEFFKAQRVTLTDWDNNTVEKFEMPFMVNGYEYEAIEAMNCIAQGKTQSVLVPMEDTIGVLRLLEECRRRM